MEQCVHVIQSEYALYTATRKEARKSGGGAAC
jgi:hypothetical protein